MRSRSSRAEICREITGELQDVASWFSGDGMTPEQFRRSVETFEAAKLRRFGFRLRSEVSKEGRVHFSLCDAKSGELCASVNVNPETGDFKVKYAC